MMHIYKSADGRSLPSVTTILKATGDRSTIDRWYMNQSHGSSAKLKQNAESQRRGDALDKWVKAYLRRSRLPLIDYKFQRFQRVLVPVLDKFLAESEAMQLDRVVFDLARGYAGTLDIALCLGGQWMIIDLKSRDYLYQPAAAEALIQCIGYAEALATEGYNFGSVAVLTATPKEVHITHVSDPSAIAELSQQWAMRLQAYRGVLCDAR